MISSSKEVLRTRYKLLPFLYTLLHESHAFGNTVVRPLVNEYVQVSLVTATSYEYSLSLNLLVTSKFNSKDDTVVATFIFREYLNDYSKDLKN